MTTLRRAVPRLLAGEAAPALLATALLLAGGPAWASHSSGGHGGGGHSGGGGGGSHSSASAPHSSAPASRGSSSSSGSRSAMPSGGSRGSGGSAFSGGSAMPATPRSSGGRGVVPIGPGTFSGPNRQPHVGGGFRGGFRNGFRDDFFFNRPFFYRPYAFDPFFDFYYPYYGGFGFGIGLGWDYPYYGYPGYYGGGYYGGYGGYGNGYYRDGRYANHETQGALVVDVSPGDTEVYLNGEYIGRARDFSGGWWHTSLWLEKGTYDIVLYHQGFRTLARQLTVYPGLVITWDDRLERGEAVRPEDLPSKSHERRDARQGFERQREEQLNREGDEGWRDRARHDRDQRDGREGYSPGPRAPQRYDMPSDRAPEISPNDPQVGRLHLSIEPDDASVYLDGRFVGTGAEIASRDSGLVVAPGPHKLAVVRPGRRGEERNFEAAAGKALELTVRLEPSGPPVR